MNQNDFSNGFQSLKLVLLSSLIIASLGFFIAYLLVDSKDDRLEFLILALYASSLAIYFKK